MQLIEKIPQLIDWLKQHQIQQINDDSRLVQGNTAFLAYPGDRVDGRQFVAKVLEKSTVAVLEAKNSQQWLEKLTPQQLEKVVLFKNLKPQISSIASYWLNQPSEKIKLFAITGTNGKTTVSWCLAQALNHISSLQQNKPIVSCAIIGTLGVGTGGKMIETGLTTPSALQIQQTLNNFVVAKYAYCAMEASSIGIEQQRMAAVNVAVAAFTNFTQDHLDYHFSMENYWQAKKQLFKFSSLQAAVVNIDDEYGAQLLSELDNSQLDVWSYAIEHPARLRAVELNYAADGIAFMVQEGMQKQLLQTNFIGKFNVLNLLAVIAMLRSNGVSLADAVTACTKLTAVPGRMQCISLPEQPLVVVDYAHTPDALVKALQALQPLVQQRKGKLHCLIGCGGNRDNTKRPIMAAMAKQYSNTLLLTSDNPRFEEPEQILQQMQVGVAGQVDVQVQVDRSKAILQAINAAKSNDVVLIAGKGHENYQDIQGVKHHFSDVEQALQALQQRAGVLL